MKSALAERTIDPSIGSINKAVDELSKDKASAPMVLVVEDSYWIQKVTTMQLKELNCDFDTADSGESAIELCQQKKYDLILLDIGLPDIIGIEVCKSIKSSGKNTQTPIVAVTAFGKSVEKSCRDAGAADYIVKPILIDTIRDCLERFVYIP